MGYSHITPQAKRSNNSKSAYRRLKQEMLYYDEVIKDKNVRTTQKIRLKAIRMGYYVARLVTLVHEAGKKRVIQIKQRKDSDSIKNADY